MITRHPITHAPRRTPPRLVATRHVAALITVTLVFVAAHRTEAQIYHDTASGHYYEFVAGSYTWDQANTAAVGMSYSGHTGHLVTITSDAENSFLASSIPTGGMWPWIGGVQPDGSPEPDGGWGWVTGEPWSFTNWKADEPNNAGNENHIQFITAVGGDLGRWNDEDAAITGPFVVEYDVLPGNIHYNPDNGHYYELVDGAYAWWDARNAADARYYMGIRGYLATITSDAERDFVATFAPTTGPWPWIGGLQSSGAPANDAGWSWVTGDAKEPWGYTTWLTGEPNNAGGSEDFLQLQVAAGVVVWNDEDSWVTGPYIVEYGDYVDDTRHETWGSVKTRFR